ncbi:N-acetylglucosamine-1-phosphotransferase subunits alpha/beta-like [Ruditapes philippinarum]|uniref:N-acetylglucosamine-1-phosphotransferase subunits alpha/beta-like n=1 Tax=Ruditapes philippinarum TaxID=129788 RepID=UPI00295BB550|nr:N-acetylglucosamine-1-phosphotransferase subunits alpha/beta-like [Ruditapes philippinarum]
MLVLKCCQSRVLVRRMITAQLCWKKMHHVLFCALVLLVCLTVFSERRTKFAEKDGDGEDVKYVAENPYIGERNEQIDTVRYPKLNDIEDEKGEQEDVDVVYTWVNGSDPAFIKDFQMMMKMQNKAKPEVLALNRYNDWGTLKYSMRSVEKNAPWIRHIYLLTNGQVPDWLDLNSPRISIVTHADIFTNKSDLPAFTSPAIESHIHRIQGLSNRFLYMNDDIILPTKVYMSDFYTERDGYKLRFIEERLEHCNKVCASNSVNNGICEANCTSPSCEFDGDDCKGIANIPLYMGSDKEFMYDSWGGSLRHTHFLLNKMFGPKDRYIPEHAAHMFDKDVLSKLVESFPDEWNRTSSTKIRHHLTIQPEFAYYNYLKELEELRTNNVRTTTIWTHKNAEKIDFSMDNRGVIGRKLQFKWCKREILLKRPKFLVFSDHFTRPVYSNEKEEIQEALTKFLRSLFPVPSQFEKKQTL